MDGDFVAGQVVVDEEADAGVDDQFLHQGRAGAHGHGPDHLAAGGLGVEDAAGGADGQHAADADLAGGDVDPDLDEMAAEGRLLVGLAEVAVLHRVLDDDRRVGGGLGEGEALVAQLDPAVGELGRSGIQAQLRGYGFAQLHAGGVDPGGRAVGAPLAARAGRDREGRVAQLHRHLVQRDAHHLGGGLGDDRVAAGADVGHVGLDHDLAGLLQPHAGAGLHDEVVAEGRRHAHADQPAAVADLAGASATPGPAEPVGAGAQALVQTALRERPAGLLRIDLGVVDDAQLDRVHAQLLGQFVDRHFQRHQARSLAGRAHGVAFGQVQRRQLHLHQPVGRGVKQAGLLGRRLGAAAGQIAGPALVADGGQLAVRRGAQADALDRRRTVGGVVEHQRPLQGQLHRPAGRLGAQRGEDGVGADEQLPAETAADIGRDQADIVLGNTQRLGDVAAAPGDHLVGGPDRQLVALPGGDGGVRLHHGVGVIGGGVGLVQLDRGGGESGVEVADTGVGIALAGRRRAVLGAGQVEAALGALVLDLDQVGGGAGLLEGLGDHDGHGLMVVLDLRTAQEVGGVEVALGQLAGVGGVDDRQHARRGLGAGQIHRDDAAFGDGGAQGVAVGDVLQGVVALIGVGRRAGGLQRAVDAVGRLADDLQLVDRIGRSGGVELHGSSSARRSWPRPGRVRPGAA